MRESDLEGLADWLECLARDGELRDSLGIRAARLIAEKFDLATQIEKLEKVYLSLTRKNHTL